MNEWPRALRAQMAARLPEGAFLRRDAAPEGGWITDAGRLGAHPGALRAAGFSVEAGPALWRIRPGRIQAEAFLRRWPEPLGDLADTLLRFRDLPCQGKALHLFALGSRLLEHATAAERRAYDKQVRQLAAEALRAGPANAYLCAQVCAMLAEEGQDAR